VTQDELGNEAEKALMDQNVPVQIRFGLRSNEHTAQRLRRVVSLYDERTYTMHVFNGLKIHVDTDMQYH